MIAALLLDPDLCRRFIALFVIASESRSRQWEIDHLLSHRQSLTFATAAIEEFERESMTKPKFFYDDIKNVRDRLWDAIDLADELAEREQELIRRLVAIDQNKFYVRLGYKSLMGFCTFGLGFSKIQSQRIVTQVRRLEPTANIGIEEPPPHRDEITPSP